MAAKVLNRHNKLSKNSRRGSSALEKAQAEAAASRDELQAQVDRLRKTEAEMLAKLNELQAKSLQGQPNQPVFLPSGNVITVPGPISPDPLAPPGATAFEFNDATYYRVPLAYAK